MVKRGWLKEDGERRRMVRGEGWWEEKDGERRRMVGGEGW